MTVSYLVCQTDDSEFYIPYALHIQKNDSLMLVDTDDEASRDAERDGIKLIYGMEGVPNGVYLDTPENRDIIKQSLEDFPEYKKWCYTNNL